MVSITPSAKYSPSSSPVIFLNGNTTIELVVGTISRVPVFSKTHFNAKTKTAITIRMPVPITIFFRDFLKVLFLPILSFDV